MKINIRPLRSTENRWQVDLDHHRVSFRSEAEARHFVATLQRRIAEPHALPKAG
ncbi:hypothetical protein [Pseudomonas oligotrophica]|uniref:hypothetical protein n=1 Tax=Pseudomonas oligotrophica TaxID=2912055 RepID=UPI001F47B357|nr:hypothetical protein [Pseudomonas oligotrophica]MCF7203943.1 hypothetical protein [Pseudomonas oligotrophica]